MLRNAKICRWQNKNCVDQLICTEFVNRSSMIDFGNSSMFQMFQYWKNIKSIIVSPVTCLRDRVRLQFRKLNDNLNCHSQPCAHTASKYVYVYVCVYVCMYIRVPRNCLNSKMTIWKEKLECKNTYNVTHVKAWSRRKSPVLSSGSRKSGRMRFAKIYRVLWIPAGR